MGSEVQTFFLRYFGVVALALVAAAGSIFLARGRGRAEPRRGAVLAVALAGQALGVVTLLILAPAGALGALFTWDGVGADPIAPWLAALAFSGAVTGGALVAGGVGLARGTPRGLVAARLAAVVSGLHHLAVSAAMVVESTHPPLDLTFGHPEDWLIASPLPALVGMGHAALVLAVARRPATPPTTST